MTQPDDEETKEQPAFPEPAFPEPAPPAAQPPPAGPPPGPGPTPPMAPPGGPPNQWQPQPPPSAPYQPPAQGWQGPPAAPTGWQQQPPPGWQPKPGQWQAPPYGAPPVGWQPQPQAWGAPPQYQTSVLAVLAGLVLIVFGLLVAVLGGWTLTQGPEITRFIRDNDIAIFGGQVDRETLRAVLSPMPGILMVLGILQLLVGAVVLTHRGWSRWLGVLLALVGLLAGIIAVSAALALVPGVSVQLMIAAVLLLGYAYVLLALIAGGSHFRARYPGR